MKASVLLFLIFVVIGGVSASEFRQWAIIGGGQFEAKLNAVGSTKVTLENRAGKIIDFPIADLKRADQDYIREWQATATGAPSVGGMAVAERSAFANRVYKDLVFLKGSRLAQFEPLPSDAPQYFAFYRSAMWCPPCRKFTPELVDFYKKHKRKGAAFELVFISSDKSEDLMAEYMDDYEMEWPAFEYGKNKEIVRRNGSGIPNLIITDAEGNKLLDSYDESGSYIGPTRVLEEFEDLLKQ